MRQTPRDLAFSFRRGLCEESGRSPLDRSSRDTREEAFSLETRNHFFFFFLIKEIERDKNSKKIDIDHRYETTFQLRFTQIE